MAPTWKMTPRLLMFNTNRAYSTFGQRIIAFTLDDGGIVFADIDRGIEGAIPAADVSRLGLNLTENDIMTVYDAAGAIVPYWHHAHQHRDLFIVLRELCAHRCPGPTR